MTARRHRAGTRPFVLAAGLMAGLLAAAPTATSVAAQAPETARPMEMQGLQTSRSGPLPDPALEARAAALASELRCPVCQGVSIHDSPSPLAQDMKDLIRAQLAGGASDADVRRYFVSRYGEWVLLEPTARGFNLLVYLLPALGLLAGATLIFVAVRRWTVPQEERVSERP